MDIFIRGKQGAGKTRASQTLISNYRPLYGTKLHDADILYVHNKVVSAKLVTEMIRAAKVRAVVFDDDAVLTDNRMDAAIQGVAAYREEVDGDLLAIYCQLVPPSARDIAHQAATRLAKNGRTPEVKAALLEVGASRVSEIPDEMLDTAIYKLRELLADAGMGATMKVTPASDRSMLTDTRTTAEHRIYPITWDSTAKSYTAANLEADGQVICSAVNVYHFFGSLKDGLGSRRRTEMLFELSEVVPVSNLHIAVDEMTTRYFQTGRFSKMAFNAANVRPATPGEVLEYLNAKYAYLQSK